MNRAVFLGILVAVFALGTRANGLSDSVAAFTGARTILVWWQVTWCNADYTVKPQCGGGPEMMMLDTKEGVQRNLVNGAPGSYISYIRISRSGKWATYNSGSKTYIIDLTTPGATPKVLLDKATCTYWCARAMWVDQTNGQEYVFCLDNYDGTAYAGNGIYKVPFSTATGAADLTKAVKINYNGGGNVDDAIAVSEDGKKLGGAFPWPNTSILDIPTGRLDLRHNGMFGCQANLAPDNSYRFHHCEDDHLGVIMFGPNMATNNWFANMAVNLVGLPSNSYTMDFGQPRWSNHVQFMTTMGPICDNAPCYDGAECSFSAAQVKSLKMYEISQLYLCKWAADFTKFEKSMYITPDPRIKSHEGDAWIASGVVAPGAGTAVSPGASRLGRDVNLKLNDRVARIKAPASAQVALVDACGRRVRHATGPAVIDLQATKSGVYFVNVNDGRRSASRPVVVGR